MHPDRQVIPDLTVTLRSRPAATPTAVAVPEADTPLILKMLPFEIREMFIDVVTLRERTRVVTTLELLSPTNKAAGTEGRCRYREKQDAVLTSRTHLIEIDLLRQGEHTVATPQEPLLHEGRWDYIVALHRGGQSETMEAWPTTVRQRLPRIKVPLDLGDSDVILDLQAVFDAYCDDGNYRRELDYNQPPVPPLRPEDAAWAEELLHAAGLRR